MIEVSFLQNNYNCYYNLFDNNSEAIIIKKKIRLNTENGKIKCERPYFYVEYEVVA